MIVGSKFFSIDLNCLIDLASRMVLSNLFHSLTQKGKKECLKLSVLQENSCKLFLFADLVWQLEVDLKLTYLVKYRGEKPLTIL